MYVNGTDNFLKYCKSHKLMNEMLDKFSWQVWVRELKEPQQKYSVDLEPKDKGWYIFQNMNSVFLLFVLFCTQFKEEGCMYNIQKLL